MLYLVMSWIQQFPQDEFYFPKENINQTGKPYFNFKQFDNQTISCYQEDTQDEQSRFNQLKFTYNIPKLLDQIIDQINITYKSDAYNLHFNKSIFDMNFTHQQQPQFQKINLQVNYNGQILSEEDSWMYAFAGLVQVAGVKKQKYQLFHNKKSNQINLDNYQQFYIEQNDIKPRTTYWRHHEQYYYNNRQAFKNRLIDSDVQKVLFTKFQFDSYKIEILGICLPDTNKIVNNQCEFVKINEDDNNIQIVVGCQRLCQIQSLYESTLRDSLSTRLNICQ